MVHRARAVAAEDAGRAGGRSLDHAAGGPLDRKRARNDPDVVEAERPLRRPEVQFRRPVRVRQGLTPEDEDVGPVVGQRLEGDRDRAGVVVHRACAGAGEGPCPIVSHEVRLPAHSVLHAHRPRGRLRRQNRHVVETAIFLAHLDALGVRTRRHRDLARRRGQHHLDVVRRPGVDNRHLGTRTRNELGVDRRRFRHRVAQRHGFLERDGRVVTGRIGNDRVAQFGRGRPWGERPIGRRAREVVPQGVAQVTGYDIGLVVGQFGGGERPLDGVDAGHPDVLPAFVGLPEVPHQHESAPDGWRCRGRALENLDRALPRNMVLVEEPVPLRTDVEV